MKSALLEFNRMDPKVPLSTTHLRWMRDSRGLGYWNVEGAWGRIWA